jgi:hypothetical protein
VLERLYNVLTAQGLKAKKTYALDSTAVKSYPYATGREKNGKQAIGKTRGSWNTKINTVTACDSQVVGFLLSAGNVPDAQAGRLLLETIGKQETTVNLLMYRAYEDNVRGLHSMGLKFNPIVLPKRNWKTTWEYDVELYKRRNKVELPHITLDKHPQKPENNPNGEITESRQKNTSSR